MLIGGVILAAIGDAPTVQVPLVGEITTWKMIFAIIGSIGLAFAPLLLTVREPVRKERAAPTRAEADNRPRSEEHTSELQSLMRISYAVFCLKKKNTPHKYKQSKSQKK